MQTAGSGNNTPALLILVGGVLAAGSAFLGWIDFVAPGVDDTLKGTDLSSGLGTLVFGIVIAVIGGVLMARSGRGPSKGAAITAIIMSALVLFVGAYTALAPEDSIVQFEASDVGEDLGISETEAKLALEQGFESGQLEGKTALGAWIATGGGLLALVGAIMAMRGRKPEAAAPVTAPDSGAAPPPA